MADTSILAELSEVVPNLSTTITRFEPHNRLMVYTISTWVRIEPSALNSVHSDMRQAQTSMSRLHPQSPGTGMHGKPHPLPSFAVHQEEDSNKQHVVRRTYNGLFCLVLVAYIVPAF